MVNVEIKSIALMYHNITAREAGAALYEVPLPRFMLQIKQLEKQGRGGAAEALLTFDDGYSSWAHGVLDAMNSSSLKGIFFVCIEFLKNGSISKEEILRLRENGMDIGSHSMTHAFLPELSGEQLRFELAESKKILEDITGGKIRFFSIPRGICFNRKLLEGTARACGYEKVFSSEIGLYKESDYFAKRIPVTRNTTSSGFVKIIEGRGIPAMAARQKAKDAAKRLLGLSLYNKIRDKTLQKLS